MNDKTVLKSGLNLSNKALKKDNQAFCGTGGVSETNRKHGFVPAFQDTDTGEVYISCHKDGKVSAVHILEGLPEKVIAKRDDEDNICEVKASIIPGFVKNEQFYTREQAAEQVNSEA